MTKAIDPKDLVCMDDLAARFHFRVELAYARKNNLLFEEQIYRKDAKLWLHKTLARVVCSAAMLCYDTHKVRFILYDGLRTIEAQKAMIRTQRAKDNPHWTRSPRLLSLPGDGGHPRGMAIDIGLEDENGALIDMGCPFDYLAEDPNPKNNPAHRKHKHPPQIRRNRWILNYAIKETSEATGIPILPLLEEWWDFRLPPNVSEEYAPLSEKDLPEEMKMMP